MSISLAALVRKLTFILCGFAALICSDRALAQDDATTEMARQRFKEGVTYYDQGEYEKARLAFLQAYTLKKHPAVLLNLAQSELKSGHEADAANHFALYLREGEGDNTAQARGGLAEARQRVGELLVTVDTPGAEITIDGEPVGKSPLPGPVFLTPGAHTVGATDGNVDRSVTVSMTAGQRSSTELRLTAPAAPGQAPTSDEPGDQEPESEEAVEATARSSLETEGFGAWFADTPLAWFTGGVALAGFGSSAVFALSSKNSYDSADDTAADLLAAFDEDAARGLLPANAADLSPCGPPPIDEHPGYTGMPRNYGQVCQQFQDQNNDGDRFKSLSFVGLAVGGTFTLVTIIYYFVDRDTAADSHARDKSTPLGRTRIIPITGQQSHGLVVSGEF